MYHFLLSGTALILTFIHFMPVHPSGTWEHDLEQAKLLPEGKVGHQEPYYASSLGSQNAVFCTAHGVNLSCFDRLYDPVCHELLDKCNCNLWIYTSNLPWRKPIF